MKKKKVWTHKSAGKKTHTGSYARVDGERQFVLKPDGGGKRIVFESHEAAKSLGWKAA